MAIFIKLFYRLKKQEALEFININTQIRTVIQFDCEKLSSVFSRKSGNYFFVHVNLVKLR